MLGVVEGPRAGFCRGLLSLSRLLKSGEGDMEGMTGPKGVTKIRFFRDWPWPQTKVMAKEHKVKSKYLNRLADLLSLKRLKL